MRLTEPPVRLAQMRPQIAWTPAVQQVMDKALQRDAALRYATANEFGRALSAAVQGLTSVTQSGTTQVMPEPESWVPPTRVAPEVRGSGGAGVRASRRKAFAIGGVVVLVVAALAYAATRGGTDADATTTAADGGVRAPAATPSVSGRAIGSPVAATPSDARQVAPDASARRAGEAPRPVERRGSDDVTVPAGGQSYGDELRALEESIADSASAMAAIERVSILKSRVTLASDAAAVQFVEAKATMLTAGAKKGCAIMHRITREHLDAGWRKQFTEGLQACERN